MFLGAAEVGKSSIIAQALTRTFRSEYKSTIEEKMFYHGDGFLLEVIDTSGSFNFLELMKMSILEGDVFVLVFSLTDISTFGRVQQIREDILATRGPELPIIVVGNKTDAMIDLNYSTFVEEIVASWGCALHTVTSHDHEQLRHVFDDVFRCFPALYGETLHLNDLGHRPRNVEKKSKLWRSRSMRIKSSARELKEKLLQRILR